MVTHGTSVKTVQLQLYAITMTYKQVIIILLFSNRVQENFILLFYLVVWSNRFGFPFVSNVWIDVSSINLPLMKSTDDPSHFKCFYLHNNYNYRLGTY